MALLHIENAALGYDGKTVVQDISLAVHEGDYLCIVGENGSGKSTLVKTVLGLIPSIRGKILYGDGLCQDEIGYMPQQTEIQKDFPASVQEIVRSGCLNRSGLRPFYSRAEKRLAAKSMERLGIADLHARCYRDLSGGQQQRVLLARALCATQKILLMDEPTSGLDPQATADLYALIQELNQKDGITVVMISHDIPSAVRYASHILHLGTQPLFYGDKRAYLATDLGKAYGGENGGNAQ